MVYFNQSLQVREKEKESNILVRNQIESKLYLNDEYKNFDISKLNFEIEIFNTLKSPKQYIYFDFSDKSKMHYLSYYYIVKINREKSLSIIRSSKLFLDLNTILKGNNQLNDISIEIYKTHSEKHIGTYKFSFNDEKRNNLSIKSSDKIKRVKVEYSTIFQINKGKINTTHKYLNLAIKWNDLSKEEEIKEVGEITYYFDIQRKDILKLYDINNENWVFKNPKLFIPKIYKDKLGIELVERKVFNDKVKKSKLIVNDSLLTNFEKGEITKSDTYEAQRSIKMPKQVSPKQEFTLSFTFLNSQINFSLNNAGFKREFTFTSTVPKILENNLTKQGSYRYKISGEELLKILNSDNKNFRIEKFYVPNKKEDY
ncbi:hypothetical protein [Mycoplasmopsis edwardii]|uniref:Uncharacterized protein n=1 Tax=Mycoplasmopsis edwardii TaxID=53558 RepID=A0ACD4PK38_9BACT|nr:hypothetical protein [Mycoplasmopsis edwardii]WBP84199.1 hypothetical protein Me_995_000162 [Mycoplasmopsis edwardii]